MLRLLFTPEWKTAAEKLEKIALWHTNSKLTTSYKEIALLVLTEIIRHKKIESYIAAMNHASLTPELLLKYSILIHVYLQEQPNALPKSAVDLLAHLLQTSSSMVQHYASAEEREEGCSSSNPRSVCTRSASTRSEEIMICKEVFLISAVVRPYLGLLLKVGHSWE